MSYRVMSDDILVMNDAATKQGLRIRVFSIANSARDT